MPSDRCIGRAPSGRRGGEIGAPQCVRYSLPAGASSAPGWTKVPQIDRQAPFYRFPRGAGLVGVGGMLRPGVEPLWRHWMNARPWLLSLVFVSSITFAGQDPA